MYSRGMHCPQCGKETKTKHGLIRHLRGEAANGGHSMSEWEADFHVLGAQSIADADRKAARALSLAPSGTATPSGNPATASSRRAVLVERIEAAAKIVRGDLAIVGARASYVWPQSGVLKHWGGYSYEIPKEEQIRSAFWSALHDRETLACELEWNLYEELPRGVGATGEVDIAGFAVEGVVAPPTLLLEVKRWWWLQGWNNKLPEMRAGIEADVRKLRNAVSSIEMCGVFPLLAGAIVVGFAETPDALAAGWPKVTPPEAGFEVRSLWNDTEVLCRSPIDNRKTGAVESRDVYSRADLLILDGAAPRP